MRNILLAAAMAAFVGLPGNPAQAQVYSRNNPYAAFNKAANYSADRWERQRGAAYAPLYGAGATQYPAGGIDRYRSAYRGWNSGPYSGRAAFGGPLPAAPAFQGPCW